MSISPQSSGLTRHTACEVVDCLRHQAAILDCDGTVVATNRAIALPIGANYLAVCDGPEGAPPLGRERFGTGLRQLMQGRGRTFELYGESEVEGSDPHLLRGRITRLEDLDGAYFLVSGEDLGVLGTVTE
ncbi:MAG: hypothetical protein GY711_01545 [bacterium]|nr:hypothetical protein [bacterium]